MLSVTVPAGSEGASSSEQATSASDSTAGAIHRSIFVFIYKIRFRPVRSERAKDNDYSRIAALPIRFDGLFVSPSGQSRRRPERTGIPPVRANALARSARCGLPSERPHGKPSRTADRNRAVSECHGSAYARRDTSGTRRRAGTTAKNAGHNRLKHEYGVQASHVCRKIPNFVGNRHITPNT